MMLVAVRVGRWQISMPADADRTAAAAWVAAAESATATRALHCSKHAATYRGPSPVGDVFIKRFRRYRWQTVVKDLIRPSKAHHVLSMSARLRRAGFRVPEVVAVGEERWGPIVVRSWVATVVFSGVPVADRLARLGAGAGIVAKRQVLAAIGREVARLHDTGFIAGDLVPANVWSCDPTDDPSIGLLDHDRTVQGAGAAPWWRARRNLVQLNRIVLPRVTTTDRLRVYRAYVAERGWTWSRACRRLTWIVHKTIERRRCFDRVTLPTNARVSFREIMRADGPYVVAPRRGGGGDAAGG